MKNYVIAHAPTSRILLALGYILMFWSTSECFGAPPVLTGATMNILNEDKRDNANWREYMCGPRARPYLRHEPPPCPPCAYNPQCMQSTAIVYHHTMMILVCAMGIASALIHPYEVRTRKTYSFRLVLIVFAFCFALILDGALVILGLVFHLFLVSTRRYWYPMPADKEPKKKKTRWRDRVLKSSDEG